MARTPAHKSASVPHKSIPNTAKCPAAPAGYELLKKAAWIWPEGYMYLYNHFAQFRYDFELPAGLKGLPAEAPLYITADKGYRLYVNGRHVCRGPARGYQSHWPYDGVDLRPYLQAGHNWLSVEAYNPGISTFQYLHQTKAGFLCAADWGIAKISSAEGWVMRRSPAHRRDTARLSMQIDFQEDCDAAADDRSWITAATIPADWGTRFFSFGQNISHFPFGQPPYEDVEARGIPLLREELLVPEAVTAQGVGCNAPGWESCENISWHWMEKEFPTVANWTGGDGVKWQRLPDALQIALPSAGALKDGAFQAVTFDLGEISVGTLAIEVEDADGSEVLDFHYHQTLRKGHPEMLRPGAACHVAFASRLRPSAGHCAHEFFHIMGIRHITVVGRALRKTLTLRLRWRTALYPFTMRGSFECSDTILNQIHSACRHTQQICAIDAYVDTPWREQAQWWGDARVQARNTFYLDGDARLLARGVRSMAGQRAPQGLTYGHAPTCSGWCILPDFALTWIMTIWDYYWQTGDLSLFREQRDRAEEILAYFDTPQTRNAEGLLINDPRFWLFEDWAPLPKENIPTFLNLWHLLVLEHYTRLLEAAGLDEAAAVRRKEVASRRKLLVRKLYDAEAGLFISGINAKGKVAGPTSVHDQVLASLLGLVPQARESMLKKVLLPFVRGKKFSGATPSAFWSTYLFDCLRERGYGAEVVDFIRQRWQPMLSTGTVWELFDWHEGAGSTCSHAWSAHPSYHLVNILAGITQTAAAWKGVRWSPVFAKGIDHAQALIPSPQGEIHAGWRREGKAATLELLLPKGVELTLDLPGLQKTIRKAGSHTFSVIL